MRTSLAFLIILLILPHLPATKLILQLPKALTSRLDVTSFGSDSHGNLYVIGEYYPPVDLQPGPDTYALPSPLKHPYDSLDFIVKYNSEDQIQWFRSFHAYKGFLKGGGITKDILVSPDGDVYLTGTFGGWSDLDPSSRFSLAYSGGLFHSSTGAFLVKLDTDGNTQWIHKWAAEPISLALTDTGEILVFGDYYGTADLNPGFAVQQATSRGFPIPEGEYIAGAFPSYVMKFNTDGDFISAYDWNDDEYMLARTAVVHSSGSYTVAWLLYNNDYMDGSVDIDPGSGEAIVSTENETALVIVNYASDGSVINYGLWSPDDPDTKISLVRDLVMTDDGSAYVSCWLESPSTREQSYPGDYFTINPGNESDPFWNATHPSGLIKFDSSCQFQWSRTWGEGEPGRGTASDSLSMLEENDIKIEGTFFGAVDLDPSDAISEWATPDIDHIGVYEIHFNSDGYATQLNAEVVVKTEYYNEIRNQPSVRLYSIEGK